MVATHPLIFLILLFETVYAFVPTNESIYELRKKLEWCGPRPGQPETFYPGLDDVNCVKIFPKFFDRSFQCPILYGKDNLHDFSAPAVNVSDIMVDESELESVIRRDTNIKAAVAIVRRHEETESRKLSVKYLGASPRATFQPWSSTKLFAAFDAAIRLRNLSSQAVGFNSVESGRLEKLGDLATIITSYDLTRNLTSNGLGAYFHSIGKHLVGREVAEEWLGTVNPNISFGGNYGEPIPETLGYTFSSDSASVSLTPDPTPNPPLENNLDAVTMAEWFRRIVHTREDQAQHFNVTLPENELGQVWEDMQDLLYGSSESVFDGLQWGGASMSTDIYVQQSINNTVGMTTMMEEAANNWRIFSKLGAGQSNARNVVEFVVNAYACLPVLQNGNPVPNRGLEFSIALYAPMPTDLTDGFTPTVDDPWRKLDLLLTEAMTNITRLLMSKYY